MLSSEHLRERGMARRRFVDFLARGLPFGDAVNRAFVYDALRDTDFPDVESWDEVESYMRRRDPNTAPETLRAVQLLWQLYVDGR
jgi:hypothetical protein